MEPNTEELAAMEREKHTGYIYKVSESISGSNEEVFEARKDEVIRAIQADISTLEKELATQEDSKILLPDGLQDLCAWCVNEAVNNAARHAHGKNYETPIEFQYFRTDKVLSFAIRDSGPGFNLEPKRDSVDRSKGLPNISPDNIKVSFNPTQGDLGIPGIMTYMDKVEYKDNTFYMEIRLTPDKHK